MAKWVADAVLDAALNYIKNNAVNMYACTSQPTTFTLASTGTGSGGYNCVTATMTPGRFTVADGTTNGRKVTMAARTGLTIQSPGNFGHVVLCTAATILFVTTGVSQNLTAGNIANYPEWVIEVADPT